jgi:hypothetical protein
MKAWIQRGEDENRKRREDDEERKQLNIDNKKVLENQIQTYKQMN